MSVAVIKSNYMHYGGGEKYAYHVVHAFAARGLVTDVLTAEKGLWVEGDAIRRVAIPMFPTTNFLRLLSFNRGVTRYLERRMGTYACVLGMDRTILQTHLRAGGGSHRGWLERRRRVSSAMRNVSFSLNPFHRYMLRIEEQSIRSPHLRRLICISNLVKHDFLHFYDFDERRISVVHNGVEWESFAAPFQEALTAKDAIRRELHMEDDRFYFLYVGSGYERKGVRYIISALREMPAESVLIVIGKDRNIGYYKNFAERRGVSGRVQFLGPR
ncbi:MAG: glycosyltransferase, partial [Thermodesulfovibrionales bacterium]